MAANRKKSISSAALSLILVQLVIAFEWFMAGQEKFLKPDFMKGFTKTVGIFAAKTNYTFYANFLKQTVLPNADLFANIVRFGELIAGIELAILAVIYLYKKNLSKGLTTLLIITLIAGGLLNINLFLAASFTGPSTAGINLVMAAVQFILVFYYISLLRKKA